VDTLFDRLSCAALGSGKFFQLYVPAQLAATHNYGDLVASLYQEYDCMAAWALRQCVVTL